MFAASEPVAYRLVTYLLTIGGQITWYTSRLTATYNISLSLVDRM